jgi:hypothetical protein
VTREVRRHAAILQEDRALRRRAAIREARRHAATREVPELSARPVRVDRDRAAIFQGLPVARGRAVILQGGQEARDRAAILLERRVAQGRAAIFRGLPVARGRAAMVRGDRAVLLCSARDSGRSVRRSAAMEARCGPEEVPERPGWDGPWAGRRLP